MIGIYKITSPKGRVYIGQSNNIKRRFKEYSKLQNCKGQTKLYNSLLKYGVDNHSFEIIEECEEVLLNERERYYQDLFNVLEFGLNCKLTTTKDKTGKISKEHKEKLSKRFSGSGNYFYNKSFKGELNAFYGKKHSEETINKYFKGENNGMYGRTGSLNPFYGKTHDKDFLRRKQLLHSNVVLVFTKKETLVFECVKDCADYFNCTTKNILFRGKKYKENCKVGMFKDIKLIILKKNDTSK